MRKRQMHDPVAEAAEKRKLERELAARGVTIKAETPKPKPAVEKPKKAAKKALFGKKKGKK